MWKYILRRVIVMIPALLAVMVVSFVISRNNPGDPVALDLNASEMPSGYMDRNRKDIEYKAQSKKMGLDKPIFYFEFTSMAYPDTLHRIVKMPDRDALAELVGRNGNWDAVSRYYWSVRHLEDELYKLQATPAFLQDLVELRRTTAELRRTVNNLDIQFRLTTLDSIVKTYPTVFRRVLPDLIAVKNAYYGLTLEASPWKLYVPSMRFYGFENQFHHWITQMLHFDFGKSYRDNRPVVTKIRESLPWSIFMGLFSYVFAFGLAVPIGVFFVRKRDTAQDRVVTTLLFLLHSVPAFVAAMLLMTFLCNPDYLYLFPTSGLTSDHHESYGFLGRMLDYAHHLVLPILVYSYHSVTLLSRQMRVSMLEVMGSDFIRTARAKGLNEDKVIWRHAMRNSLVPLINSLAHLPPRLVAGAVIVETIFSVPGMGRLIIDATNTNDHPVIVAAFTLTGLVTIVGILLGDILYALTDPRISFSRS